VVVDCGTTIVVVVVCVVAGTARPVSVATYAVMVSVTPSTVVVRYVTVGTCNVVTPEKVATVSVPEVTVAYEYEKTVYLLVVKYCPKTGVGVVLAVPKTEMITRVSERSVLAP